MSTFGTTIGSGGFRFHDANHEISYNYIDGVFGGSFQGPLMLDSGDAEGTSTNLAGHWRVVNALVERNVLIGNTEGIRIGNNYSLAPTGCTIRDNLVAQAGSGAAVTQLIAPANTTFTNNTYSSTPAGGGFTQDAGTIWRKAGYGPRITFLQVGDVGIAGDAADTDYTGALIAGDPGTGGGGGPAVPTAPVGQTTVLDEKFDSGVTNTNWSSIQTHTYDGSPSGYSMCSEYRMCIGTYGGSGTALRTEVRDGDTAVGSHERCEISSFGKYWNDNGNTERWYEFDVQFATMPSMSSSDDWLIFFQWHNVSLGDAPPLAMSLHNDGKVYFEREPDSDFEFIPVWTPVQGTWYHVVAHIFWSSSPSSGFIECWVNDQQAVARRTCRTQYTGDTSNQYVKLGQYRRSSVSGTSVLYHDNIRVSSPPETAGTPTASPQTVTVASIGAGERFGLPTVTVAPGGTPSPPPAGSVPTQLGINTIFGAFRLGYSYPGDITPPPGPSGSQTVSGAGGIASGQAFGLPVVAVADGPMTIVGIGIPSAETFGRPLVVTGAAPAPAPGGVLVPSLWAVGSDGTTLAPLPAWTKITVAPVRNSPGALTVDYPAGAAGFSTLHDGVSAYPLHALEVRIWLGGNATGAVGGWLVQKSGDDLTPGSNWTYSGHFHEWLLSKALVGPQEKSTANPKGELRFAGATAGLILQTMMDQAQARGALPLVTRDFNSLNDSAGQAWAQRISSFNVAPKTTIDAVADKLVELAMCEYEFTAARVWRAYNPGTKGRDRTADPTPLTFAQAINLSQHARQESARDAGTTVLAAGAEGFYAWADSPTAKAQLGWRAEVAADAGQVASEAGIAAVAAAQLEAVRNGVAGYNGAIEMVPGSPLPLIDWGIGDWAYTLAGNTRRRLRVAQIGLTFAQGELPRGTVVLNDLIADALTKLYRKINALSTGDAVIGTSTSTTGDSGEDTNPPAAPTGVVVSSTIAYRVAAESTVLALVSVGWAAVTNDAYADSQTAAKAQAAVLIAQRIQVGNIQEDWSYGDMPTTVAAWRETLSLEYQADPGFIAGTGATLNDVAIKWLFDWPAAHQGGGAITDDVAEYHVQFSYIGGTVVGTYSPTPGWVIPRDPNDPSSFGVDYSWHEPDESPTAGLTVTFGDVTAERAIGVRVCAVDRSGNQGPWSAVVGVVTAKDDTAPPAPSTPVASSWFETMDITWDGNGSSGEDMRAAAPDLDGVEVHVSTGIAFLPDRPIGADGKIDYAASGTYQATLYTGGTWNVTDLTIGTTYFARLVAVDKAGNASPPSDTSAGVLPKQLVQIDIGPNAIGRQQIIDLEVVTGKIADLAVNNAKISDLSVGKLTAGTLTAQVVNSGRISTPVSNGNQIQIDAAGIRLYQGSSVVGSWNVFDASMMVTGQSQTAVTGQRIVMNPGGNNPDTIRFYPTFSDVYSSIDSVSYGGGTIAGIRIIGSADQTNNRRGELIIRDQYASLVHGDPNLSYWGSEIFVQQNATRCKSNTVDLVIDERLPAVDGPRRVAMIHYDTNGVPINATGLYYHKTDFGGGEPFLYGNAQDVGIIWANGILKVRNLPNDDWRPIMASVFTPASGRAIKRDIRDLDDDPTTTLRRVSPKRYRFRGDNYNAPERIGFVAEDLPYPVRVTHTSTPTDETRPVEVVEGYDLGAALAVLWGGVQKIEQRLTALEGGHP